MGNIVTDRIKEQLKPAPEPVVNLILNTEPAPSKPIEPNNLADLLESQVIEPEPEQVNEIIQFLNIYDFVTWYLQHKDAFSEPQVQALETLVQSRDMIHQGCACKTHSREQAAQDYFRGFWMGNLNNDMIPTVLKIAGSKRAVFGNFLSYPQ